jgi:hypothetical protein
VVGETDTPLLFQSSVGLFYDCFYQCTLVSWQLFLFTIEDELQFDSGIILLNLKIIS